FHRIHDAAAFGYHGLSHLHGAVGGHRISGDATEHDLAVAAANADGSASGARTYLFLEIADVRGDLYIDHAGQLHALIEYRNVGSPNPLALNIEPILRHRQCVNEFGGTHDHAGERLWEHQGARFVKRHRDMLYAGIVSIRLRILQGPSSDPKQRASYDQWHAK